MRAGEEKIPRVLDQWDFDTVSFFHCISALLCDSNTHFCSIVFSRDPISFLVLLLWRSFDTRCCTYCSRDKPCIRESYERSSTSNMPTDTCNLGRSAIPEKKTRKLTFPMKYPLAKIDHSPAPWNTFSFVFTICLYSLLHGGDEHRENSESNSEGERASSRSRSCCINKNVKNCCPLCESSVEHPGGTLNLRHRNRHGSALENSKLMIFQATRNFCKFLNKRNHDTIF